MAKDRVRLSKVIFSFSLHFLKVSIFKMTNSDQALSWMLRHNAEKEGFVFLEGGFLPVQEVLKHKRCSSSFKTRNWEGMRRHEFFIKHFSRFRGGGYTLEDVQAVVAECPKQRFSLKTSKEVSPKYQMKLSLKLDLPRDPCSSGLTKAIPSAQWRYLKCYFCVMRGNPFDSFVVFLMEVWMGWRYNLFGDKKWQLRLNWRRWWIHLKHLL